MNVEETPHPPLESIVRVERAERYDLHAPGEMEGPAFVRRTVTIVNLSRSGCLVRGHADIDIGESITIWIPGVGNRRARLRRISGNDYGCSFEEMLKPAEVNLALEAPPVEDASAIRTKMRETIARSKTEMDAVPASMTLWSRIRRARTGRNRSG